MQNKKPEFTDYEIEAIVEHLNTHNHNDTLALMWYKCKYYLNKERKCKNCDKVRSVELFVWDQPEYCVDCAPWYKDQDFVFTDKDTIYCKKCGETYTSIEEEFFYQTCQLFTCRNCKAQYISKKEQERINRRNLEEKTKAARVELGDDGEIKRVYINGKLMKDI